MKHLITSIICAFMYLAIQLSVSAPFSIKDCLLLFIVVLASCAWTDIVYTIIKKEL